MGVVHVGVCLSVPVSVQVFGYKPELNLGHLLLLLSNLLFGDKVSFTEWGAHQLARLAGQQTLGIPLSPLFPELPPGWQWSF